MSASILIIEDDPHLQESLSNVLLEAGYHVEAVGDGLLAIASARKLKPDLIVLDLFLPGLKGCEVYRLLRKEMTTPVLLLAASQQEVGRLEGATQFADNYLLKPFSIEDFLTYVRARLPEVRLPEKQTLPPSPPPMDQDRLGFGDLEIHVKRGEVTLGGKLLRLKPKEYQLLYFLALHQGKTLSREVLLERVWGAHHNEKSRTVDVHVRWLRQKIEPDSANPTRIVTVRGGGYRFEG